MDNFWSYCVRILSQQLPAEQIRAWIEPLTFHSFNKRKSQLRIVAPTPVKQKWVKSQYGAEIQRIGAEWFKEPELKLVVDLPEKKSIVPAPKQVADAEQPKSPQAAPGSVQIIIESMADTDSPTTAQVNDNEALSKGIAGDGTDGAKEDKKSPQVATDRRNSNAYTHSNAERSHLNPEQTFATLVVGKSNEFPAVAARTIAENPGSRQGYGHNPFYIYGSTGLGKTHIMHAIGNEIIARFPDLQVRYIHANQYYTDMSQAYLKQSFDAWKQDYDTVDVLLIDDIQFLKTKKSTQEQFFHLFERMTAQNKQIVIASDIFPTKLEEMSPRLTTRFNSGLTVAIEPPELEMREAILQRKALSRPEINLTEDAAHFIASHVRSNVRELEGALTKVIAYAGFHNIKELTVDLCRLALSDLLSATAGRVTVENIQKIVAEYFKIRVSDMYSKRRQASIAKPRQIAMYLSKELTQKSLPAIGEIFGGRDHTTVLHAVRKISKERLNDEELNHQLHVLEQTLKG